MAAIKKAVKKVVAKTVKKKEVVTVKTIDCAACDGRGLETSYTLCRVCHGNGKVTA